MSEQKNTVRQFVEVPKYQALPGANLLSKMDPLLRAIIQAATQELWGEQREIARIAERNFRFTHENYKSCWIKVSGIYKQNSKCPLQNTNFTLTFELYEPEGTQELWMLHEIDFRSGPKTLISELTFAQRSDGSKYIVLYPDGLDHGSNFNHVKSCGHEYSYNI
jgi:hypothetical protein